MGKTSSLGTLLVRLEIIATTYHSMIVQTYIFSLYSHICTMHLYSNPSTHGESGWAAGDA